MQLADHEKNIRDALELARTIFEVIKDPRFIKETDAETRHRIVCQKYPNFSKSFPIVVRMMARDLKYYEKAFRKYLYKLNTPTPGAKSGIEGFMEKQADYVKFLYIEDCRSRGAHWSAAIARKLWQIEYNTMHEQYKKIQEDEKKAKNEFEEEQQKNLELRKKELLEFINIEEPPSEFESKIEITNLESSEILQLLRSQLEDHKSIMEDFRKLSEKYPEFKVPETDPDIKLEPGIENNREELIKLIEKTNMENKRLEKILIEECSETALKEKKKKLREKKRKQKKKKALKK